MRLTTALLAFFTLISTSAFASDVANLCFANLNPSSPYVSLPADDSYHYPDQWTGSSSKYNLQSGANGFESTFKFWHWTAVPVGGGAPVHIGGFRAHFAVYIPSPFAGGQLAWVRLALVNLIGPDGAQHQFLYAAPGEYAPKSNGYDLAVGGPGEAIVLEVTDTFAFVPTFTASLHSVGSGGTGMRDDFVSTDGQFEVHSIEESVKRANYPFNQGGPVDGSFSYYWARSYLSSTGTVKYAGQSYYVLGTSWEERQWPGSSAYRWKWLSVQIKGCIADDGTKFPCAQSLRTIAAFDIVDYTTGAPRIHDWSEVGPPPSCNDHHLTAVSDWSLTPTATWTSPRFGTSYARQVRLQSTVRGVDLTATAVIDDQETYKAAFAYPGTWEGEMSVTGTIGGQKVYGEAFLEQFQQQ